MANTQHAYWYIGAYTGAMPELVETIIAQGDYPSRGEHPKLHIVGRGDNAFSQGRLDSEFFETEAEALMAARIRTVRGRAYFEEQVALLRAKDQEMQLRLEQLSR